MTTAPEHPFNPPGTTQPGLFGGEEMAIDVTFAGAHRIELDAASWVEHIPGWLTGLHLDRVDAPIKHAGTLRHSAC